MRAGMAAEPQELPALLPLLLAALSTYGCPEGSVSDHGAVCRAGDAGALLKAWEMAPRDIELRQPWQHLREAPFKGQLRLADCPFAHAQPCEESQTRQAAFGETFTTTWHWAPQERPDGRRPPAGWDGGGGGPSIPRVCGTCVARCRFCGP